MKILVGIFFLFLTVNAFAQKQERPLVQFTGIIYNADSAKVIVPYVTITNKSYHKQVYVANYEGYFSFVAHEQDTLLFTSIGFASKEVIIPANLMHKSYTTEVLIKPQVINLPVFRVFPWATTDEFRKDFLSMKLADDDLENARKNLMRSSILASQSTLARDAQEIQSYNGQEMHNRLLNEHSITNPLLNPIAWGSLIKQIADGDKSRTTNN